MTMKAEIEVRNLKIFVNSIMKGVCTPSGNIGENTFYTYNRYFSPNPSVHYVKGWKTEKRGNDTHTA